MTSNRFTRQSGAKLTETAMRAGLQGPNEAEAALEVGARMQAHGFTGAELDGMILDFYRKRAESARA